MNIKHSPRQSHGVTNENQSYSVNMFQDRLSPDSSQKISSKAQYVSQQASNNTFQPKISEKSKRILERKRKAEM